MFPSSKRAHISTVSSYGKHSHISVGMQLCSHFRGHEVKESRLRHCLFNFARCRSARNEDAHAGLATEQLGRTAPTDYRAAWVVVMVIAVCVARSGSLSPSRLCMHELAALSDCKRDRCLCVSQCLSRLVDAHCSPSERGGAGRLCVSRSGSQCHGVSCARICRLEQL